MSKKPLVSVCMITYNHEKYIAEAIEGVLMQAVDFPVEFIIADDCSTDKTPELISKTLEKNNDSISIKSFRHESNKGLMGNFLWILEECKGKYVAFCEGDDIWGDPDKLKKQVHFLENHQNYVATFHQAEIINESGEKIGRRLFPFTEDTSFSTEKILRGQLVPLFTAMFVNQKVLSAHKDDVLDLKTGDILLFSLLSQYGEICYLNSILPSFYRIHQNGVWSQKSVLEQKMEILLCLEKLSILVAQENRKFIVREIADYSYEIGKILSNKNDPEFRKYFLLSTIKSFKVLNFKLMVYSLLKLVIKH